MATRSVNKAIILGNLTADPDMKSTNNGTPVATFAVATNRTYTTADGDRQEAADFHNIVAFGKLAEICEQLLQKGSQVYLEGRLQTRKWDDDDGKTNYKTEIVCDNVILLARGKPFDDDGRESYDSPDQASSSDNDKSDSKSESKEDSSDNDMSEEVDAEEIPF